MPFLIMTYSPSVIIGDFDLIGSVSLPDKADSPLLVDPDAVLSGPIPFQHLQPISWWGKQVIEFRSVIEHGQFPFCRFPEAGELLDHLSCKEQLRLFVAKASDHDI